MSSVLIVDDDPVHRMIVSRVARKEGLKVKLAETIDTALEALGSEPVNCVTLDLNLGADSGIRVIEALSTQESAPWVLLISGSDMSTRELAMERCRNLRLRAVEVPKPIDLPKLRNAFELFRH